MLESLEKQNKNNKKLSFLCVLFIHIIIQIEEKKRIQFPLFIHLDLSISTSIEKTKKGKQNRTNIKN